MSRRARARAGVINAKRIAFAREPETFDDDESAAPDADAEAWAWAAAVSREFSAGASMKSGGDTATPSATAHPA